MANSIKTESGKEAEKINLSSKQGKEVVLEKELKKVGVKKGQKFKTHPKNLEYLKSKGVIK